MKTLWRTFFCALIGSLTLGYMNPYGNGRLVQLYVDSNYPWQLFELIPFIFLGVLGVCFFVNFICRNDYHFYDKVLHMFVYLLILFLDAYLYWQLAKSWSAKNKHCRYMSLGNLLGNCHGHLSVRFLISAKCVSLAVNGRPRTII